MYQYAQKTLEHLHEIHYIDILKKRSSIERHPEGTAANWLVCCTCNTAIDRNRYREDSEMMQAQKQLHRSRIVLQLARATASSGWVQFNWRLLWSQMNWKYKTQNSHISKGKKKISIYATFCFSYIYWNILVKLLTWAEIHVSRNNFWQWNMAPCLTSTAAVKYN